MQEPIKISDLDHHQRGLSHGWLTKFSKRMDEWLAARGQWTGPMRKHMARDAKMALERKSKKK